MAQMNQTKSKLQLDPFAQIAAVENGLPANILHSISKQMCISTTELVTLLGFSRATIGRKLEANGKLNLNQSEIVNWVLNLSDFVDLGEATYPWIYEFLQTKSNALAQRTPASLIGTDLGRQLVFSLVQKMESGAYA
jgi:putative toxin-antitoxin system antitoxin component (TIGR02293 family)